MSQTLFFKVATRIGATVSRIGILLCLCVALKATPAGAVNAALYPDTGTTTEEIHYYFTEDGGTLTVGPYTYLATDMYGSDAWQVSVTYSGGSGTYYGVIDGFSGSERIYINVTGVSAGGSFDTGWALFEAAPTPPTFEAYPEVDASYDVEVDWSTPDSTDDLQGFDLYRSVDGGDFDLLFFFWPFDNYYIDNLYDCEGLTVQYLIVAYNYLYASSEHAAESYVTVKPPPLDPTNLSAVSSANGMLVQWTDNSQHNDNYTILRAENGGQYYGTLTTTVSGSATQFVDTNVNYLNTYSYKIIATSDNGTESNEVGPTGFVQFEY
ncbi:MAG: hypothetical protein M1457_04040 [bacterium]|nr:hypothetical protein [bacterium]